MSDGAERLVLSASRAGGHPTLRQTHQRAQRRGLPDTFQVPTPRSELSGSARHIGLSRGWRVGGCPEGGVGPQKSQQFSTPLGKRRGERGGRDARGAPSARQNRQRCSSRATRSQTPNLLIGGRSDTAAAARRTHTASALKNPEGTRRWRHSAGRGPRGPAAAPAPPPPPWPPLPVSLSAAAARRLPGAQLPGSPACARAPGKGGGAWRVSTARDGAVKSCWLLPALEGPFGSQHSLSEWVCSILVGDEDIPFCALPAPLCVAGNGWRENLAWRLGFCYFGGQAGVSRLGGFSLCENSNAQVTVSVSTHTSVRVLF